MNAVQRPSKEHLTTEVILKADSTMSAYKNELLIELAYCKPLRTLTVFYNTGYFVHFRAVWSCPGRLNLRQLNDTRLMDS